MRKLIAKLALAVLLLLLGTCAFVACLRTSEVKSESYGSYAEAEAAGLFGRGWMPSSVPQSAREIAVTYDLDTSSLCGRVQFDPADAPKLQVALVGAGYSALDGELESLPGGMMPRRCPFRHSEAALGDVRLKSSGVVNNSYGVIDTSHGQLYLWTLTTRGE